LKFLPGRTVLETGTLEMRDRTGEPRSRRSRRRLFDYQWRRRCVLRLGFHHRDQVAGEWPQLKPAILGVIMEHFMSGAPVVAEGAAPRDDEAGEFFEAGDADTVATIKELIETRVRPAVANDGGDITFRGYKDGVVYLAMKGRARAVRLRRRR
jgi:hypothetical protein